MEVGLKGDGGGGGLEWAGWLMGFTALLMGEKKSPVDWQSHTGLKGAWVVLVLCDVYA